MKQTLDYLVNGLIPHIKIDGQNAGMLYCRQHEDHHTRACEAAFPIAYLGKLNHNPDLMEKGFLIADKMIDRQNSDGSWYESPGKWRGTTVFQLMSLAALIDILEDELSDERKKSYIESSKNAAIWTAKYIGFRRATTNYVASGAAALALCAKRFSDKIYWMKKAADLAKKAASRINVDGLVEGEGRNRRILKKINLRPRGIDIGYGLEMTLASLALYAQIANDRALIPKIDRAIRAHLYFMYKDGTVDNSLGSRGFKWTVYGSKTTHGCQMALAFAASRQPAVNRALNLSIKALNGFCSNGLMSCGPASGVDEPCLYPTVTRACNLAMSIAYFPPPGKQVAEIPAEKPAWIKTFKTMNSAVFKAEPWMATVSGYGYATRYPDPDGVSSYVTPSGGTTACLFHSDWGLVQAATPLDYRRYEYHVPEVISPPESLSPRIELSLGDKKASSAYEKIISMKWSVDRQRVFGTVHTRIDHFFKNLISKGGAVSADINIDYTAEPGRLLKRYRISTDNPLTTVVIIEPVILLPYARVREIGTGLELFRNGRKLCVQAKSEIPVKLKREIREKIYCPLPSLEGIPFTCRCHSGQTMEYSVLFSFEIKKE